MRACLWEKMSQCTMETFYICTFRRQFRTSISCTLCTVNLQANKLLISGRNCLHTAPSQSSSLHQMVSSSTSIQYDHFPAVCGRVLLQNVPTIKFCLILCTSYSVGSEKSKVSWRRWWTRWLWWSERMSRTLCYDILHYWSISDTKLMQTFSDCASCKCYLINT